MDPCNLLSALLKGSREAWLKSYIMSLIKLALPLLHSTLHNHSLLSTQPTYTPPILHLIGKAERWEVFFNTLLTGHLTGLWHAGLAGGELNISRGKIPPQPNKKKKKKIICVYSWMWRCATPCVALCVETELTVGSLSCLFFFFFLMCWWHTGLTADLGFILL